MNRPPTSNEWKLPIDLAREADFSLGRFEVSPSLSKVRINGQSEAVEPRVMQALVALAQRNGQVVSRDELIERCWAGRAVSEDAVQRCIAKVRKLSELDPAGSFFIETIPRIGYQLIEAVIAGPQPIAVPTGEWASPANMPPELPATKRRRLLWIAVGAAAAIITASLLFYVYERPPSPNFRAEAADHTVMPTRVTANGTASLPVGATFRDCAISCPEMIVVPPGYFTMGSAGQNPTGPLDTVPGSHDDESPQREVLIAHKFAAARFDVTREEYARFVDDTHRPDEASCQILLRSGLFIESTGASWRHPGYPQTMHDPVVCISWIDAHAYAAWLSRKTLKPYRVPTEAEWEYLARAGTNSAHADDGTPIGACRAFNGGDLAYHKQFPDDHFADMDCSDGYFATSPVGSFPANAFGLFDMQGNVWQWTQDCYHESYDGAPSDGSAWATPDCTLRVARGGSWADDSHAIRLARREKGIAISRYSSNGFRVVRAL
jgi:sulfatase modifying factor 1